MSGIIPKMKSDLLCGDWPWPVSRKTSEGGVKKSFLFEPQASLSRLIGKPSNVSFSNEAGTALTFFDSFFVSRQKRNWGKGAKPQHIKQLGILPDIHFIFKLRRGGIFLFFNSTFRVILSLLPAYSGHTAR